jgi:3-oxoacyl-[acyl-carrier-protein] synthase II
MRRVAITGVGLVTPLGTSTESSWEGLVEGRTAVGPIKGYDASSLRTQVGAEIENLPGREWIENRRALRSMTRDDLMGVGAAVLAVRDSGLEITEEAGENCALFVGSNKETSDVEGMMGILDLRDEQGKLDVRRFGEEATGKVPPLFFVQGLQAASLFYISEAFGLKGENTYFAGTAETGGNAIGRAFRAIRRGELDTALAGAYDDPVSWWAMSKLDGLEYTTGHNELGEGACRPYDRDRDGAVMGEGAAFLLLEELEAAKARGARVYAEITGFGSGFDAGDLLTPEREGEGLSHAIESALREAGSAPDAVGYVAAHGSATRRGDASEAHALRRVFGSDNGALASSVKAATGHLWGGAGALNAAVAALVVHHGAVPPTLNLENKDPDCDALDWVPREARETKVREALALARGFEGQNVALTMRAVD